MEIWQKFIAGFKNFDHDDTIFNCVDQDVKYAMLQQRKRWKKFALTVENELEPAGALQNGHNLSKNDGNLINRLYYLTCLRKIKIIKDDKTIYKDKEKEILYISELDCGNKVNEETVYVCPGCGAITTVSRLVNGCSYCGSYFLLSDLYPTITNYYFLSDFSLSPKESKSMIAKWCVSGAVLLLMLFVISFISSPKSIVEMIFTIFMAAILGGFVGYMAMSLCLLAKIIFEAIRSVILIGKTGLSWRKNRQIKEMIPGFSQSEFEGRIISAIKMIVFSDKSTDLTVYEGRDVFKNAENIVEMSYGGGIGIRKCFMDKQECHLRIRVPLDNLYYLAGKVKKKREYFDLEVHKVINGETKADFSVQKVKCKNCSHSFDGRYQKYCPYCGSEYRLSDDDWVISCMERV